MHACTLDSLDPPADASPSRRRHGALLAVVGVHLAALVWLTHVRTPTPTVTVPVVVTLYADSRTASAPPAQSAEPKPRRVPQARPTPASSAPVTPAVTRRDAPTLATESHQAAATTSAAPAAANASASTGLAGATNAASTTAALAAPTPVTPPVFSADYLQNPAPAYPNLARRQGQQGRVVLRVLVNATGAAEQLEVRTSSGHAALDGAALEAVRRWRFVPARQGQDPVPAWVLIPLNFFLQG